MPAHLFPSNYLVLALILTLFLFLVLALVSSSHGAVPGLREQRRQPDPNLHTPPLRWCRVLTAASDE